jgi:hypothetical protein
MSRTLSSEALKAFYASETGDYPIILLEISHETLTEKIYISSDATQRISASIDEVIYGTVSNGIDYVFMPFNINLPNDIDDAAPTTQISIDNVSRHLVTIIRTIQTAPYITMKVVMFSHPDTVEVTFPNFRLDSITYDSMVISGDLSIDLMDKEPFPSGTFTPAYFPGLF